MRVSVESLKDSCVWICGGALRKAERPRILSLRHLTAYYLTAFLIISELKIKNLLDKYPDRVYTANTSRGYLGLTFPTVA